MAVLVCNCANEYQPLISTGHLPCHLLLYYITGVRSLKPPHYLQGWAVEGGAAQEGAQGEGQGAQGQPGEVWAQGRIIDSRQNSLSEVPCGRICSILYPLSYALYLISSYILLRPLGAVLYIYCTHCTVLYCTYSVRTLDDPAGLVDPAVD
jgi:hypothetical protein